MNPVRISACLLAALAALPQCARGENSACIRPGAVLQATGNVVLRQQPPRQKFLFAIGGAGVEVGKLAAGATLTVTNAAIISAPLRQDVWVQGTTANGVSGWAYCGTQTELTNFKVKE